MSCITKLLEMKGDREILPIHSQAVIEGGGSYTRDHGPLPDTHEHFPVINRMLDAAALYKEDCEHE
jgi:hypothetical protein